MFELKTKEKVFYSKNGKPQSVLIDYKIYKEMLELIEDNECIKIVESRRNDALLNEEEFKKRAHL